MYIEINEIIKIYSEVQNILFVNNKSTDNSLEFIINNKHLINCQNISIISNKQNYGMYGSQKIALIIALTILIKIKFVFYTLVVEQISLRYIRN